MPTTTARAAGDAPPATVIAVAPPTCETDAVRLDVFYGLLLAPHFDAAFDQGLTTVAEDATILVSDALTVEARASFGFHDSLKVGGLHSAHERHLRWHRASIFRVHTIETAVGARPQGQLCVEPAPIRATHGRPCHRRGGGQVLLPNSDDAAHQHAVGDVVAALDQPQVEAGAAEAAVRGGGGDDEANADDKAEQGTCQQPGNSQ